MKPFKTCHCKDERGYKLGKKCPERDKRGHCKWYVRIEAPAAAGEKRRQVRIGPFDTEKIARDKRDNYLGQVSQTGYVPDQKITLGAYLDLRLGWREADHAAGEGLKRSTLDAEREAIALYLKPGLGHIKLVDLRDVHIRDLYAAMRLINRGSPERPSEMLRRLLAARAPGKGGTSQYSTRPLSESRVRRVHAVLSGALGDAVTVSKLIPFNPANGVMRSRGGHRKPRVKPLLWTAERVARWQATGKIPSPVMVWSTVQCGAFLDFAEHDRLYFLFHLAAYWGPRRGELVGLEWTELGLDTRRLHILQSQVDDELDSVKTGTSDRHLLLDEATAGVGTSWRKQQLQERLAWGEAWTDSGRVFTYEDGRPLRPPYVSQRFELLCDRYRTYQARHAEKWSLEKIARRHRTTVEVVRLAVEGPALPPVRLHDLRHGAATMLLAAGVDMKVVSDVLGHASQAFTSDVYAVVAEELAEDAAVKIAAFVPRRNRA
jgi:integrase